MIPKIIHYCWFGGNSKPKYVKRCISSWKKFFPGYEIKEWNESNFDVNIMPYSRDAYAAKKYAFVSDVARFWILYHVGGLYFDTDVEVIKSFDDILVKGAFVGCEAPSFDDRVPDINPGLAFGAEPGNSVAKAILDYYFTLSFFNKDGVKNPGTVVAHATKVLTSQFGLQKVNGIQNLEGITVYPTDFFNPFDDLTGRLHLTSNSHSIHWFAKSWMDMPFIYYRITRILHRFFGTKILSKFKMALAKLINYGK